MLRLSENQPVAPIKINVGDRVLLGGDDRWWTVRAVSPNFVACVRQRPFKPKGELLYTVLDWRNGVRGPCNLIGQGYGDGTYSEEECAEMLVGFEYDYQTDPNYIEAQRAFEAGEAETASWPSPDIPELEISHRNQVPLVVIDIQRRK